MNYVLVLITLYLFIATLAASFVTAFLLSRSASRTVRTFAFLVAFICIYLAGYMMEINSEKLADMMFWNQVQYVGVSFYPAVWMVMAIRYTNRSAHAISRRAINLLMLIPACVFLARFTNSWHHLFYSATSIRETPHLMLLVLGKGPLYYVNSLFNLVFSTVPLWLYLRHARQSPASRIGGNMLFTAAALPSLGYAAILLDRSGSGIDYVALALPVSIALSGIALLKYDFLDVHGLARAAIFDRGKDALILLDAWHQMRDSNRLAKRILPELDISTEHQVLESLLAGRPELLAAVRFEPDALSEPILLGGFYYEVHVNTIYGRKQRLVGYLLTLADVTEKQMAHRKLQVLATRDTLTGLSNRGNFESLASLAMQQARQGGQPCALLMVDIDHFKRINDNFGHATGDAALKAIGQRMQALFRTSDIIGRIGGEEFAIFLPGSTLASAGRLADRFREAVEKEPIEADGLDLSLTVSIGVAEFTPDIQNLTQLLRCADCALYDAKHRGRNRIAIQQSGLATTPPFHRPAELATST